MSRANSLYKTGPQPLFLLTISFALSPYARSANLNYGAFVANPVGNHVGICADVAAA